MSLRKDIIIDILMKCKRVISSLLFVLMFSVSAESKAQTEHDEVLAVFKDLALEKIRDLGLYIRRLADKKTNIPDMHRAIDLAVDLFIDEDASVQVTNKITKVITSYPIRVYLNRLTRLPFSQVTIEWYEIHYVSEIRLGTDGLYHGVATVYEKFVAISGDQVTYEERSQKNVEIIIEKYDLKIKGELVRKWDVFLNDIVTVETS